jgi:ligand-binding sensor protein
VSEEEKRIPRKPGQPAKSKQHSDLYTDENPEGTIHGLGFKDVKTAKASVQKIKSSDRTHAHKVQAAVAMEQRAKEMGKKEEAAVYRSFINFMKEKTKERQNEAVTTRIESDRDVLVVQGKDGKPFIYDSTEKAQKKADEIKGKVIVGTEGEVMVQVLVDPSLRKHMDEEKKFYTKKGKIKQSPEDKERCQRSERQRGKAKGKRNQEANVIAERSSRCIQACGRC